MPRLLCPNCQKEKSVCYCDSIIIQRNEIPVLILQHPHEQKHFLNTASMAQQVFTNVQIIQGEDFTKDETVNRFINQYEASLIYPTQDSRKLEICEVKTIRGIILLDGTWKKTYKILQLSKNLQKLDSYHISPSEPSIMYLRKAPKNNYLSTLESLSYTLEKLENKSFIDALLPLKCIQTRMLIRRRDG